MGGPMDKVIGGMGSCFSSELKFDPPILPGLPNFALGTFLGTMAPITMVLGFLPPDPTNLPSPPSLSLILKPFTAAMKVPGLGGPALPGFDPLGAINLVLGTIKFIFKLFTNIITSIISLSPELPTPALGLKLFKQIALPLGFAPELKLQCIPLAIVGLITSLIPL